jgi:hypothetical protein
MGKLTKEMVAAIESKYNEKKSYKEVADELGVNWKTVKAHIHENIEMDANDQFQVMTSRTSAGEAINNSYQEGAEAAQKERRSEQDNPLLKQKSPFAKALRLFEKGMTPIQVAYTLNLSFEKVEEYYAQYGKLNNVYRFFELCQSQSDTLESILQLHDLMKEENMSASDVVRQLKYVGPVREASQTYARLKEQVQRLQIENAAKLKKNSRLESEAREVQARTAMIQNNITDINEKLKQVRDLHADEKVTFEQLLDNLEHTKKQIEEKEAN